jgi:hypothetical protein
MKGSGRGLIEAPSRLYPEETEGNTRNLNRDSWCCVRDLNQVPSDSLPFQPLSHVGLMRKSLICSS